MAGKADQVAAKLAEALEQDFRQDVRHAKCGGVYVAHSPDEILADDADCPVCENVRRVARESRNLNLVASPNTPLADELGMVFSVDKVGPVSA